MRGKYSKCSSFLSYSKSLTCTRYAAAPRSFARLCADIVLRLQQRNTCYFAGWTGRRDVRTSGSQTYGRTFGIRAEKGTECFATAGSGGRALFSNSNKSSSSTGHNFQRPTACCYRSGLKVKKLNEASRRLRLLPPPGRYVSLVLSLTYELTLGHPVSKWLQLRHRIAARGLLPDSGDPMGGRVKE